MTPKRAQANKPAPVADELVTCAWQGCSRKIPTGPYCQPHTQRAARRDAAAGAGNNPNRRATGAQKGNHPQMRR